MAAKRRKDQETRRAELIAAAGRVFDKKGVANSTVSDIVKAAGVAQGTFYLYFESKNEIINALVERMVDGMVETVEQAVADASAGAGSKFHALRDAIIAMAGDSAGRELAEIYHRPENQVVHDRMAERITPRLFPLVEQIVQQGIDEGIFNVDNPRVAAWFILGGLHMLETGFKEHDELVEAVYVATELALRVLGCAAPSAQRRR